MIPDEAVEAVRVDGCPWCYERHAGHVTCEEHRKANK